jgi:hypothetical protein
LTKAMTYIADLARNRRTLDVTVELSRFSKSINRRVPSLTKLMKYSEYMELLLWAKKGRPVPPPHEYKEKIVKDYAKFFSITSFIETGTYRGDMVEANKTVFDRIYSIELDDALFVAAKQKFSKYKNISIIKGDSGIVLPQLLKSVESPSLFWLDAHYSSGITAKGEEDTPILKELKCIFNHPVTTHVILIDDAHCFTGQNGYPTIEELKEFVFKINPRIAVKVENNIIRIVPVVGQNRNRKQAANALGFFGSQS